MKKYFAVSFKHSENVYCSNIAHAETAEAVNTHYAKYEWVSVRECEEYEVEAARRKGMPIVEIETPEAVAEEPEQKEEENKMIVTRDTQRLYLRPLDYNMYRIFSALAEVIENHGGKVKPQSYTALISDRNIDDSEIISAAHTGYITFTFEGMVYYFQVDENPFFPFYYSKTPLRQDNKYSHDACLNEFTKNWLYDCFWSSHCPQANITDAANLIFNELCKAPKSEIIRSSHSVEVPNTYSNGWHKEKVLKPERLSVMDW